MTVTTNERGQQNLFAKEPPIIMTEVTVTHNEKAEMLNGRLAIWACDRDWETVIRILRQSFQVSA